MGEINAYKISVGKPGGKRPQGRPGRRWKDNIRRDLKEREWIGCIWLKIWAIGGLL
jgi:hypothetical protein